MRSATVNLGAGSAGPIYDEVGKALDAFASAWHHFDSRRHQAGDRHADGSLTSPKHSSEFNSKNPATASLTLQP
jgi:hypothetical protein